MRILVTYGWCRTAYVVAQGLAQLRPQAEVFVCDSTGLSMTRFSRFVKGFFLTPDPFVSPEPYAQRVAEIVKAKGINVVIPVHEDALVLQKYKHYFPQDTIILSPDCATLEVGLSKWAMMQVAKRAGVSVPETKDPADVHEALLQARQIGFPLLLKTRRGNSSKGVFVVDDENALKKKWDDTVFENALSKDSLPILQQLVPGNVYGACFLADKGKVVKCFTEEYLHCKDGDFGTSTFRNYCDWPLLRDYTQKLVLALGWTGIGHFDFVGNQKDNKAFLIEMNPRYWGALKLSVGNGYNFPAACVSLLVEHKSTDDFFKPPLSGKGYRPCLWLVGEMIALVNYLKKFQIISLGKFFKRLWLVGIVGLYDDFLWSDPLPFFVEMAYYARDFIRGGFSTNPVKKGMIK